LPMKILISGAGIAGTTLAFWLARFGFQPTIVEKAPHLRTGGYVIDFWGAGFDIANRMGLLPELFHKGYSPEEVRVVNRAGERVAGFPTEAFSRVTNGRYISLARGDLAASIFHRLDRVETIFGDSIQQIEQSGQSAHVVFETGLSRDFDLVVGADGLHSRVREIVFGPSSRFEIYLGYKAAAFSTDKYRPRDESVYVMYTEVGQQITRFAMHDDRTMFLFTFADGSPDRGEATEAGQKSLLRRRFGNSGWECSQILDRLDAAKDLYYDRVSQIRMSSDDGLWSQGRVILVGDAAFCVSLLAGQGSALAMIAAYLLAGELHCANGDYAAAFARYQNRFGSFVARKQRAALRLASSFAPGSRFALFLRNQVMNLMRWQWVADFAIGRDLGDRITIPDY